LRQLRRVARPDRARVAAYIQFSQGPEGWGDYREFLANHRAWLAGLDRALAEAPPGLPSLESRGPLPELESEGALTQALPLSPPRSPAQALGYLYVLEAFRLGSEVLRRHLKAQGEPQKAGWRRPWGELVRALSFVPPEDQPAVVESARDLFSAWERRLTTKLGAAAAGQALAGT
jgi:heme oxygenase